MKITRQNYRSGQCASTEIGMKKQTAEVRRDIYRRLVWKLERIGETHQSHSTMDLLEELKA